MKRSGPPKRRTPLRSRRPAPLSIGQRRSAEWHRARLWAIDRAKGRCEARCNDDCTGRAEHVHHMLMRSQGGTHDLANLLAACHRCHGYIHDHPAESYERGWLIRRSAS